jgi:hypothetical protein
MEETTEVTTSASVPHRLKSLTKLIVNVQTGTPPRLLWHYLTKACFAVGFIFGQTTNEEHPRTTCNLLLSWDAGHTPRPGIRDAYHPACHFFRWSTRCLRLRFLAEVSHYLAPDNDREGGSELISRAWLGASEDELARRACVLGTHRTRPES